MMVLLRNRKEVEYDAISLASNERTLPAGVVIMGLSALAFAADIDSVGVMIFATGLAVTVLGALWKRKRS